MLCLLKWTLLKPTWLINYLHVHCKAKMFTLGTYGRFNSQVGFRWVYLSCLFSESYDFITKITPGVLTECELATKHLQFCCISGTLHYEKEVLYLKKHSKFTQHSSSNLKALFLFHLVKWREQKIYMPNRPTFEDVMLNSIWLNVPVTRLFPAPQVWQYVLSHKSTMGTQHQTPMRN